MRSAASGRGSHCGLPRYGRHPVPQRNFGAGSGFVTPVRPDPPVTPDSESWWNATRERRLTVQACDDRGNLQFYPRAICTACGRPGIALTEVSGDGRIYSFTIIHRPPDAENFPAPYLVALVRLEEGHTLLSNIVGPGHLSARCDAPVPVTWEALPDGR